MALYGINLSIYIKIVDIWGDWMGFEGDNIS